MAPNGVMPLAFGETDVAYNRAIDDVVQALRGHDAEMPVLREIESSFERRLDSSAEAVIDAYLDYPPKAHGVARRIVEKLLEFATVTPKGKL